MIISISMNRLFGVLIFSLALPVGLTLSVGLGLIGVAPAMAQEMVDVNRQVEVESEDAASAKQKLMDKAIEEVSYESIEGIIGEEKTRRSQDLILNKIIKKSGRYILSLKGDNFTKKGKVYVMDVGMKVSLKGLRSLLLEQGLLYQMDGPPKVLPVIQMIDRMGGRSYGWWYQDRSRDHAFLSSQTEFFHNSLRDQLRKIGFYAISPLKGHLAQNIPDAFRGENMQRADHLFLGEYFKSSVVVRGQVVFRAKPLSDSVYMIDARLEALHSGNGRLMAELTRTYETDPGQARVVVNKKFQEVAPLMAEDLSTQLSEAWKKGTFGASVLKLAVVGRMTPKELDEFKKTVVIQIRDIKSLRERLIEANKTTFEVDSSVLPQQLAQVFRSTKLNRFKVEVNDVSSEGLTIKVETL